MRADELGKKAWSEVKTLVVRHRAGGGLAIQRSGTTLELSVDFTSALLICNENGNSSYNGFSFENGVLKLDHRSDCNIDNEDERVEGLTKLLEQSL